MTKQNELVSEKGKQWIVNILKKFGVNNQQNINNIIANIQDNTERDQSIDQSVKNIDNLQNKTSDATHKAWYQKLKDYISSFKQNTSEP